MRFTKNETRSNVTVRSKTDAPASPPNVPIRKVTAGPIDCLLSRLQAVRKSGGGRWMARCPAHDDKHPSLSIAETSDGTVLLKCFAGCGVREITCALGISLSDLFPAKLLGHRLKPIHRRFLRHEVFDLLRAEAGIIWLIGCNMRAKRDISDRDYDRLCEAVAKMERIAEASYGV